MDALNGPEPEVAQKPKSGMSNRAGRTRLLFQITGFQRVGLGATLFSLLATVHASPIPVHPLGPGKRLVELVILSNRFSVI